MSYSNFDIFRDDNVRRSDSGRIWICGIFDTVTTSDSSVSRTWIFDLLGMYERFER